MRKYYMVFATEVGFTGAVMSFDHYPFTEQDLHEASDWLKENSHLEQNPVIINWLPVN